MPNYWLISDRNNGGTVTSRNTAGLTYFISEKGPLNKIANWREITPTQFRTLLGAAADVFPALLHHPKVLLRSFLHSLLMTSAAIILLVGCAADKSVLGPKPVLAGQMRLDLTPAKDISEWREGYYSITSKEEDRQFYRNEIIRRLMRLDDESFDLWSQKLYGTRAISNAIADFATGLMGAFAAASGASSAQTLGLAVAGVSGARSAADKDLFLEKSAGALISKMKEDRAKVDAQITQYLGKKTINYPLEQGLRDIIRYYEAGTLASASETLQSDAKVAQLGAQGLVENIKGDRVIAPSQIKKAAIEPELPMRTKETVITNADIALLKADATKRENERKALATLLVDTNDAVNKVRIAIEAKDPTKRIDYEALMKGTDPKAFPRTQNGLSKFLQKNANNPTILKAVRDAANAQMPAP